MKKKFLAPLTGAVALVANKDVTIYLKNDNERFIAILKKAFNFRNY